MCNSKCQLFKALGDHYNKINEEDLKRVGNIKDFLYIRVFKMDLLQLLSISHSHYR